MNKKNTIAIVMAIYKPDINWLIVQLKSLNEQIVLPNRLIIWNDCPTDDRDYSQLFDEYITKFPYEYHMGKKNLGSTLAFGELTKLVIEDYIAYCDQDDQWLPNKLQVLLEEAKASDAELICSDMRVMDGKGNIVAERIGEVRPRQVFPLGVQGEELFRRTLSHNYVTGCTTLIKTDFAKSALPFPKELVHDWWLALWAAAYGRVCIVEKALINYRIHGNNQTGILAGIKSKEMYYEKQLGEVEDRVKGCKGRFGDSYCNTYIQELEHSIKCRQNYRRHPDIVTFIRLFNIRKINPAVIIFELILPFMPECLFLRVLDMIRQGKL